MRLPVPARAAVPAQVLDDRQVKFLRTFGARLVTAATQRAHILRDRPPIYFNSKSYELTVLLIR